MKTYRLIAGDSVVIHRLAMATGILDRTRGLLGRGGMKPGEGMLLSPCNAVHTLFMRFTIDVVFLDSDLAIARVCRGVRPFSMAFGGRRARHAVEVQSGWLDADAMAPGSRVSVQDESGGSWAGRRV